MDLETVVTVALAMATVMDNEECDDPRVPFEVWQYIYYHLW